MILKISLPSLRKDATGTFECQVAAASEPEKRIDSSPNDRHDMFKGVIPCLLFTGKSGDNSHA